MSCDLSCDLSCDFLGYGVQQGGGLSPHFRVREKGGGEEACCLERRTPDSPGHGPRHAFASDASASLLDEGDAVQEVGDEGVAANAFDAQVFRTHSLG